MKTESNMAQKPRGLLVLSHASRQATVCLSLDNIPLESLWV